MDWSRMRQFDARFFPERPRPGIAPDLRVGQRVELRIGRGKLPHRPTGTLIGRSRMYNGRRAWVVEIDEPIRGRKTRGRVADNWIEPLGSAPTEERDVPGWQPYVRLVGLSLAAVGLLVELLGLIR